MILGAACLGALVLGSWHVMPAQADKASGSTTLEGVDYGDKDGDWVEFWKDEQDRVWIIVVQNREIVDVITPNGDPGPDDEGRQQGDFAGAIALLKQRGGPVVLNPTFADSPLGKKLTRAGKGLIPVYNPSDTGFEDGGTGGHGIDPGAGDPEGQLKRLAKHGKGDGGQGDDGSDLKPGDVGLFDDQMPGPPPLVNPNPVATRTFCCTHATDGSGGGAGGNGGMGGGAKSGGGRGAAH
ncbi:MAG TPA: hypothetical protein VMT54_03315 [Candidatus Cybelea sp.]|nr:hypothetical protein [Candidatus Cybelea sp.]